MIGVNFAELLRRRLAYFVPEFVGQRGAFAAKLLALFQRFRAEVVQAEPAGDGVIPGFWRSLAVFATAIQVDPLGIRQHCIEGKSGAEYAANLPGDGFGAPSCHRRPPANAGAWRKFRRLGGL